MNKIFMVSTVALLAGMGQAQAQAIIDLTPESPAVAATCQVGGVSLPQAGDAVSCASVGGVYDAGHPLIPAHVGVNGDATVNGTATITGGVKTPGAGGSSSTMDGNGFSFQDGHGGSVTIKDPTIIVTNGVSSTTIHNGDVTSTGTVRAGAVIVNGRDVESSLNSVEAKNTEQDGRLDGHDTRITHVQTQADATDTRLNGFNGGGTIENWASSVNTDISNLNNDVGHINNHLGVVDSRLDSLEGWRATASSQINDLYKQNKKAFEGTSIALSMPDVALGNGKKGAIGVGFGTFSGESAVGLGGALAISNDIRVNAGVGFGTSQGTVGGKVSATYSW